MRPMWELVQAVHWLRRALRRNDGAVTCLTRFGFAWEYYGRSDRAIDWLNEHQVRRRKLVEKVLSRACNQLAR